MEDKIIYVVFGTTGEYSDREEWLVKAYHDEECAKNHVLKATEYATMVLKEINKVAGFSKEYYEELSKYKKKSPYDKDFVIDYSGTRYYYESVELE